MTKNIGAVLVWCLLFAANSAQGEGQLLYCEPLKDAVVMTYNDANDPAAAPRLHLQEAGHFTPKVEGLIDGQTAPLPEDIAFVLAGTPNHHRALLAMARWQIKHPVRAQPGASVFTIDCYFQRAFAFRPDDAKTRFVYGIYLHGAKRLAEAQKAYEKAEELGFSSAELYYNLGLLEFDRGNIGMAREYAGKAYGMGYPLPGLRDKLNGVGKGTN